MSDCFNCGSLSATCTCNLSREQAAERLRLKNCNHKKPHSTWEGCALATARGEPKR
jgi:hypothetical protein